MMGPAGAVLRLTPGEFLNADGTVSQRSSGGPMWWSYTLRGNPEATDVGEGCEPLFGYYGFRYVQAEWVGRPPQDAGTILSLLGVEWHSASKEVGRFESSNTQLNQIHSLIVHAMHNNEMSLFTDCPHREKLGWLEETQLVARALMFNNDLEGLYRATDGEYCGCAGGGWDGAYDSAAVYESSGRSMRSMTTRPNGGARAC